MEAGRCLILAEDVADHEGRRVGEPRSRGSGGQGGGGVGLLVTKGAVGKDHGWEKIMSGRL